MQLLTLNCEMYYIKLLNIVFVRMYVSSVWMRVYEAPIARLFTFLFSEHVLHSVYHAFFKNRFFHYFFINFFFFNKIVIKLVFIKKLVTNSFSFKNC